MSQPELPNAARLVLSTAPDAEVARRLARLLVEARLAACVNLLPGATSVYRWHGALQEEAEVLLICKTTVERLAELEERLLAEHPYDTPEFVVIAPDSVSPAYLAWLRSSVALPDEA